MNDSLKGQVPLALLVLMCTAWLVLTGTQLVYDSGDLARFGMSLFQLLAPLQLAVAVFFSALLAASAVAPKAAGLSLASVEAGPPPGGGSG